MTISQLSQNGFEESTRESPSPPTVTTNLSPAQEETQRLSTILETGQMLAGTLELKDAMSRVLAILGRQHGMMRGLVMLLDLDTNELRIVASHGLDEDGA